jgi:hypothetical protein
MRKLASAFFIVVAFLISTSGQVNEKIQLHFIDVEQGDAAVLISQLGENVLFDDGVAKFCDLPITYLDQQFVWSKNSCVFHHSDCKYVSKINPENLVKGNTPSEGKT